MHSKLLSGVAALTLATGAVLTSVGPASAAWGWHGGWHRGFGWGGAVAAGVVGGALAAATAPLWAPGYYDYYPGYAYGPAYGYAAPPGPVIAQGSGDIAYCEARFRSYDPTSGTYLGFDGLRHPCP